MNRYYTSCNPSCNSNCNFNNCRTQSQITGVCYAKIFEARVNNQGGGNLGITYNFQWFAVNGINIQARQLIFDPETNSYRYQIITDDPIKTQRIFDRLEQIPASGVRLISVRDGLKITFNNNSNMFSTITSIAKRNCTTLRMLTSTTTPNQIAVDTTDNRRFYFTIKPDNWPNNRRCATVSNPGELIQPSPILDCGPLPIDLIRGVCNVRLFELRVTNPNCTQIDRVFARIENSGIAIIAMQLIRNTSTNVTRYQFVTDNALLTRQIIDSSCEQFGTLTVRDSLKVIFNGEDRPGLFSAITTVIECNNLILRLSTSTTTPAQTIVDSSNNVELYNLLRPVNNIGC